MNHQEAAPEYTGDKMPEKMLEALHFINTTSATIFLTGKAGTGKTTFLKNLSNYTYKKFIIVAPTGIAALNAGGVTVHAQFMFPFGMFIPEMKLTEEQFSSSRVFNDHLLTKKNPLSGQRKKILRSIDLLVIDEVSMLRADLLDAIDFRLKEIRKNFFQPFGGVQLLLIGDLHQLPPVVRREEEALLRNYYRSPWFFEAKCLNPETLIYIELNKIFRQQDEAFIKILNNLRNNKATADDINRINEYYNHSVSTQQLKDTITLTTHNHQADEINQKALDDLRQPAHHFSAKITGEFPETMFPASQHLTLKEGCQIMFIKNDGEGKMYYNGKLATITDISSEGISVRMEDQTSAYLITPVVWENKRFRLDQTTNKIYEDIIGTFEQYPVKLAWAITIHKSQGLTFDRAVIDPGKAFANGQVYVALSRLRTLEGLTLRTPLTPEVITTDQLVADFTHYRNNPEPDTDTLKKKQIEYIGQLMIETFNYDPIIKELEVPGNKQDVNAPVFTEKLFSEVIAEKLKSEKTNTERFRKQLLELFESGLNKQLKERLDKGVAYYLEFLWAQWESLWVFVRSMRTSTKVKGYQEKLEEADLLLFSKIEATERAQLLIWGIVQGEVTFDFTAVTRNRLTRKNAFIEQLELTSYAEKISAGKQKKISRKDKIPSAEISIKLFESGMKPEQIARERGITESTVISHLSAGIEQKRVSIFDLLPGTSIEHIQQAINKLPGQFRSKEVFDALKGKYNYNEIRAVMLHLGIRNSKKE